MYCVFVGQLIALSATVWVFCDTLAELILDMHTILFVSMFIYVNVHIL